MDFLKELFNSGAITFEQFVQGVSAKGIKLADLSKGEYVAKSKYDDDIAAKDTLINDLNGKVSTRDNDLATLKKQLEDAGNDKGTIADLTKSLEDMQTKYDTDTKSLQAKIKAQESLARAKAVSEDLKFTSKAAQEMFVAKLVEKDLPVENDKLLGLDDFISAYKENNADSFSSDTVNTPQFTASTSGNPPANASYESRLAEARKSGNTADAVAIKREAAENGVILM